MRAFFVLVMALGLSACATPGRGPAEPRADDPLQPQNRAVFEFNRRVDKALLRPAAKGYVTVVPDPVVTGIGNFAENLSLPGVIVNNLLQGDGPSAAHNTLRFLVNSTIGLAGILDPADATGLYERDTDFGATLHAWGIGEGDYLVLPIFGPSTTRDAVGTVVDFFTNPLTASLSSDTSRYGTAAYVLNRVGDRGKYAETVDSILYDSADPYGQARSLYLQNRRYELGDDQSDAYLDPYSDPYEDPYAE